MEKLKTVNFEMKKKTKKTIGTISQLNHAI